MAFLMKLYNYHCKPGKSMGIIVLLLLSQVLASEGLKCLMCSLGVGTPDNEECHLLMKQNTAEKYLKECPPLPPHVNETENLYTLGNDSQTLLDIPLRGLIGKVYCYTFTRELNGKLTTERGCGSSKVPENLHGTCENVTDKNTSALVLAHATVCYCSDLDGCNNEFPSDTDLSEETNFDDEDSIRGDSSEISESNLTSSSPKNYFSTEKFSPFNSSSSIPKSKIPPNYQNPFLILRRLMVHNSESENSTTSTEGSTMESSTLETTSQNYSQLDEIEVDVNTRGNNGRILQPYVKNISDTDNHTTLSNSDMDTLQKATISTTMAPSTTQPHPAHTSTPSLPKPTKANYSKDNLMTTSSTTTQRSTPQPQLTTDTPPGKNNGVKTSTTRSLIYMELFIFISVIVVFIN